ncbi:MAG TPA: hypothetical protein VK459_16315, partial [Polyangiaceae bacterium]|nr:hypothetical protein [Polyangiaceae bacterium]
MKQRMRAAVLVKAGILGAVAASGCAVLADLDHSYELSSGGGGGGGSGGSGGGGDTCEPGSVQVCYTGPAGTQGVGACKGGLETCAADGSAWGPCEGEVKPTSETCSTPVDDDCNGMVNDGCTC